MTIGLKLNSQHDLELDENGAFRLVTEHELIAQAIQTRLSTVRGEVLLDETYGVEYFGSFGSKAYNLKDFERKIKQTILETDGVLELTQFTVGYSGQNNRLLEVSFKINTVFGVLDSSAIETGVYVNVWNVF